VIDVRGSGKPIAGTSMVPATPALDQRVAADIRLDAERWQASARWAVGS
jgi:hypothetical protein